MTIRRGRRWVAGHPFALALVIVLAGACTGRGTPPALPPSGQQVITVASFDFVESELLAQLYAQALQAKGYPVRVWMDAGTRELLQPALAEGLVDLIPEYSGSALSFLTLGNQRASTSVELTHQALSDALVRIGAVALTPAPAQDANVVVVTDATAHRYNLHSISDLAPVAKDLVFGGPPECPERPLCLRGLADVYGLTFQEFVAVDTGGPLTLQALHAGGIEVALLFSTDPAIAAEHLVVLTDSRGLQPAENITPIVRRAVLDRYGPGVGAAIDAVSGSLTTDRLRALLGQVGPASPPRVVASRWLHEEGLA